MDWRHGATARRILASETGVILRDWGGRVPIVLAYPNSYAVGMASLAIHSLYRWFNALPGVVCERAFASLGAQDASAEPLVTLESQRPVAEAAVLAFSLSFELDYGNVLAMLRRAKIPLRAAERGQRDPLVLLGGPAISANPEPLAFVADAIVIGEAEALLGDLLACVGEGRARQAVLEEWARLPGVYVPLLHRGETVRRQWLANLDDYPTASSIVAPLAQFGDMHLIEISRGCGRGCRFCLAGYWYRPPRERSLGLILDQAREGLAHRQRIGLVAAAVSDYSQIDTLVVGLRRLGAKISVSSLRVAPLGETLLQALAESGARSLTLAPEAGSERLRRRINKGVTHDAILRAAGLAAHYGFETLKLYFMVGLPGEEDEDIAQLIALVQEVQAVFARKVTVNVTPFVPKAHTPFERVELAPLEVVRARLRRIQQGLRAARVAVQAEPVEEARLQAILARGDRRVGAALEGLPQVSLAALARALERQGVDVEEYLRARAPEAPLPWDFITSGVSADYRQREWRRSLEAEPTACCTQGCSRCGVCGAGEE